MKTVVLNSNTLWSIVQFRKELILELQKEYRIVCIAGYDTFSMNSHQILKEMNVEFFQIRMHRKSMNPFKDLFYCFKLFLVYKRIKPDLIIHYTIKPNIYGSFVASLLHISSFAVISGLGSSFLKKNIFSKFILELYRFTLLHVARVLFLNESDLNEFVLKRVIPKEKSFLLESEGVNIDFYKPSPFKDIPSEKIVFLMVARLLKDKGIYEYIEAIKYVISQSTISAKFLLAGAFDEDNPSVISRKEVVEWEEKGYISYLGETENIQEFFMKCDIVVLPSYREGMSRVLLEACSCEKFIIASDVPGCKELCMNKINGFLVKPQNILSLANAIEQAIKLGREELRLCGKEGRKLVCTKYSSSIVNQSYKKLIKSAIGK